MEVEAGSETKEGAVKDKVHAPNWESNPRTLGPVSYPLIYLPTLCRLRMAKRTGKAGFRIKNLTIIIKTKWFVTFHPACVWNYWIMRRPHDYLSLSSTIQNSEITQCPKSIRIVSSGAFKCNKNNFMLKGSASNNFPSTWAYYSNSAFVLRVCLIIVFLSIKNLIFVWLGFLRLNPFSVTVSAYLLKIVTEKCDCRKHLQKLRLRDWK